MDLRETGWGGMDWIYLAQERNHWKVVMNTIMSLSVPYNVGKWWPMSMELVDVRRS
jgi:hypothetical protein